MAAFAVLCCAVKIPASVGVDSVHCGYSDCMPAIFPSLSFGPACRDRHPSLIHIILRLLYNTAQQSSSSCLMLTE